MILRYIIFLSFGVLAQVSLSASKETQVVESGSELSDPQEALVEMIEQAFQNDRLLIRSVTAHKTKPGVLEEDVWFDLDQSVRQKFLDNKAFHEAGKYQEILDSLLVAKMEEGSQHETLYESHMAQLESIKKSPKTMRLDFSSKEAGEASLKEYFCSRQIKNQLHKKLKELNPKHTRKNSISTSAHSDELRGFEIKVEEDSILKLIFPQVTPCHDSFKFNSRNRVEFPESTLSEKVIVTPSCWSYTFSDDPIHLYKGSRSKELVFGLLTIEDKLCFIRNTWRDINSTSMIDPGDFHWTDSFFDKDCLKNGAEVKALRALEYEKLRKMNPGEDIRRYIGGFQTEALAYGSPLGIIVQKGFEKYALKAKELYVKNGILPSSAPFFYYETSSENENLSLTPIKDEDLILQLGQASKESL